MKPSALWPRVLLGGTPVDLFDNDVAIDTIIDHVRGPRSWPLGVMSANLDHIHHFGHHGPSALVPFLWAHPDADEPFAGASGPVLDGGTVHDQEGSDPPVRWLNLLDGAPLVRQATHLTGHPWPRLAGSDLIGPILDRAEAERIRVGFLGGMPDVLTTLAHRLAEERPDLPVAGLWSPDRADLDDPAQCRVWARRVRDAGTELLVVGLGKPRQERWIVDHGPATGASVLLAFGAVVDFLAGAVQRAPEAVRDHGMEWAWRLALEPRRLARRYLVDGPPAFTVLARRSFVLMPWTPEPVPTTAGRS